MAESIIEVFEFFVMFAFLVWIVYLTHQSRKQLVHAIAFKESYQQIIKESQEEVEYLTMELAMIQEQFAYKLSLIDSCKNNNCGGEIKIGSVRTKQQHSKYNANDRSVAN